MQRSLAFRSKRLRRGNLIVLNDGSTDSTADIIASMGGTFPIRRIDVEQSSGPIDARNLAIKSSVGEFIAECDADDIWFPEKLARQWHMWQRYEIEGPVAVVGCYGILINEAGKKIGTVTPGLSTRESFNEAFGDNSVLVVPHSGSLFRRQVFDSIGGYDPTFLGVEDSELWERFAATGAVINVPEALFAFRKKRRGGMESTFWLRQINRERIVENRRRQRRGESELTFEKYSELLNSRSLTSRLDSRRRNRSQYFYELATSRFVNGERALGLGFATLSVGLSPLRSTRLIAQRVTKRAGRDHDRELVS